MPAIAPAEPDAYLSTDQIAALCGKSPRTVRRWLARGILPSLARCERGVWRVSRPQLRARLDQLVALRCAANDVDPADNDGECDCCDDGDN
jgi:DNA-binding transcriptional MerR regulator